MSVFIEDCVNLGDHGGIPAIVRGERHEAHVARRGGSEEQGLLVLRVVGERAAGADVRDVNAYAENRKKKKEKAPYRVSVGSRGRWELEVAAPLFTPHGALLVYP